MGTNGGEFYESSLGPIGAVGALVPSLLQEIPFIIIVQVYNK